jgi:hypothetical protein
MTQRKLDDGLIRRLRAAKDALINVNWKLTSEGHDFWEDIYNRIQNKANHGTTDGKPWVEPELTDEDALRRPWVKVKDYEETSWSSFVVRLVYVKPAGSKYRFSAEDPNDDHEVRKWNFCRIATPEEIEAANADR